MNTKLKIATFLACCALVGVVGAMTYEYILSSTGNIMPFYEVTCTPDPLDWGDVTLNTPATKTVDVANTGTKNIVSLAMTHTPTSTNLLSYTLTWDLEGEPLEVGYYLTATFTLTITEGIEGPFTMDITVGEA